MMFHLLIVQPKINSKDYYGVWFELPVLEHQAKQAHLVAQVDQYQQFLIFLEVFQLFSSLIEVVFSVREQSQQPFVRQCAVFQSLPRLDYRDLPKYSLVFSIMTK